MRWTPEELTLQAQGTLVRSGRRAIHGVFIDSRRPRSGGLFVPIVAARDGHDFITEAIAAGASAVLVGRGRAHPDGDVTIVEVDDTLAALQRLGTARRRQVRGPVVAISGSNGKTTTRAMIAAVLASGIAPVLCTRGNLNNHLGVPLTLLDDPEDPAAMVIELGMSAPGENDLLARIVEPDIAVVTSVAIEHLEFMKTIEAIAAAEAEPLRHVPAHGLVVVPSDESLLTPHLPRGGPSVVRVGPDAAADVRIVGVTQGEQTIATLAGTFGEATLRLPLFGLHNARNAAAALAVGLHVGLPLAPMIAALEAIEPVGDRGRTIAIGPHLLIADCYNANPGSVAAALASLAALPGRRRIAVLGDMLELGPDELALHREVGHACAGAGLTGLVAFGPRSRAMAEAAGREGVEVLATESVEDALGWVAERSGEGAAILVKASRGMKLERVIAGLSERLRHDGQPHG